MKMYDTNDEADDLILLPRKLAAKAFTAMDAEGYVYHGLEEDSMGFGEWAANVFFDKVEEVARHV